MQKLSDYKVNVKNRKGKMNKVLSSLMTALVIGMLIFVGPVDAYSLELIGLRETAYLSGEVINFQSKVDIHTDERVQIQQLKLEVNHQIVCTFEMDGTPINGCDGINITLVKNTAQYGYGYGYNQFQQEWIGNNLSSGAGNWIGYGYNGYGYGYTGSPIDGELVYDISIRTPQPYFFFGGNNRIMLITETDSQILTSRAENIAINPQMVGNGNFLMGEASGGAIFWGRFNSTGHTLVGEVQWIGSSFRLIGVGSYKPITTTSGDIEIRFYDPTNPLDSGITWYGNYSNGMWTIGLPGNNGSLSGPMFLPPQ